MTTQNGGLVGFISRAATFKSDPLRNVIRLAFAAGFLAIWMHSGAKQFGFEQLVFSALLGAAALLGEYHCSKRATKAWLDRSVSGVAMWTCVWVGCLGYSMNAWMGVASHGVETKAGQQKAAFVVQNDTSATEAELTKKNNDLLQRIAMAPQRGPEAALAAIKRAEADKLWERTKGCTTNVAGATTRPFCDGYASAVADLEAGKNLTTWKEEQASVAAELKQVRTARANAGPAVMSASFSDTHYLETYVGLKQQAAIDVQAFLRVALVSILLSVGGVLLAKEEFGTARKPWPFMGKIKALLFGAPSVDEVLRQQLAATGKIEVTDSRDLKQAMKMALQPYAGA